MVLFTHFVRANQQLGFFISETSTVNTQSVHKTSKSVIAEMNLTNTTSLVKRPSMAILPSEIFKFAQDWWSKFLNYFMIHSLKTLDSPLKTLLLRMSQVLQSFVLVYLSKLSKFIVTIYCLFSTQIENLNAEFHNDFILLSGLLLM